jgi:hypothetical protein
MGAGIFISYSRADMQEINWLTRLDRRPAHSGRQGQARPTDVRRSRRLALSACPASPCCRRPRRQASGQRGSQECRSGRRWCSGKPVDYLGHHIAYNEKATLEAQQRADAFMDAHMPPKWVVVGACRGAAAGAGVEANEIVSALPVRQDLPMIEPPDWTPEWAMSRAAHQSGVRIAAPPYHCRLARRRQAAARRTRKFGSPSLIRFDRTLPSFNRLHAMQAGVC